MEHIINGGGYEGAPLDENALRIEPEHLAMNDLNIQGTYTYIIIVISAYTWQKVYVHVHVFMIQKEIQQSDISN